MVSVELIARVIDEGSRPGSAQRELGKINYGKGRRLAQEAISFVDFAQRFYDEIVLQYIGPWEPKRRALDGALEAVDAGKSHLTAVDIIGLMDGCKNVSKPYRVRAA